MLLAETISGLSLKFQVAGICINRRRIVQLGSSFGSISLLFLMKVAGAHAHSSQRKSPASNCIPYSRMKIILNIISNNLLFYYLVHERAQR